VTRAIVLAMQILENDQREDLDRESKRQAYLELRAECGGNASAAVRMLGISRPTWYRATGERDPDAAGDPARPSAASRISLGQLTRALDGLDTERLHRLNGEQAKDLAARLERILQVLRDRPATPEQPPRRPRRAAPRP
jgi:hypothetical protein